jgi:hypothetical protein
MSIPVYMDCRQFEAISFHPEKQLRKEWQAMKELKSRTQTSQFAELSNSPRMTYAKVPNTLGVTPGETVFTKDFR